ncbi:glycosyltransferase family 2 protein [Halomonadaceae bacterium KBTZ08]
MSEQSPRVSVLLVTANRSEWLEPVLRSLQAQTLTDWELIAVDCDSTDDTLERLSSWAQSSERVRVLSVEATDRAVGRRQALQKVRGDYVAWADPQTGWPNDFLENLLACSREAGESRSVIYAPTQILDGEGGTVRTLPGTLQHATMVRNLFEEPRFPLSALLIPRRVMRSLEKTGMRFVLSNDHALLLWLAHQAAFEPAAGSLDPVCVYPAEGTLPMSLDPVAESRGEAMTYALENFRGAVPARFARRCLATFHCRRSRASEDSGEALASASRALMYRPLWPRAWKQLLSVVLR